VRPKFWGGSWRWGRGVSAGLWAIVAFWDVLGLTYNLVYLVSGGITAVIAVFCFFAYPQFESPHPQNKRMVLRKRYWLFYALQFMAGARRQIFVVFAGFMMVERFGMKVSEMTMLLLVNYVLQMVAAPAMGRALGRFGERNVMVFEYVGLTLVFLLVIVTLWPFSAFAVSQAGTGSVVGIAVLIALLV